MRTALDTTTLKRFGLAAGLALAVLPALRKLVLAAGQWDKLKDLSPEDWNRTLDDPLASKPKK